MDRPLKMETMPEASLDSIMPPPDPNPPRQSVLINKPAVPPGYLVESGDTLYSISKKHYGTPSHWELIYQANKDQMKRPGDLKAGMRLVIPAKPGKK